MIKVIACIDSNWGIGLNGELPWPKLKEDMKYFRKSTLGQTCVVGYNTWEKLGNLPDRETIVYSREMYNSVIELSKEQDIWIIGGAKVYKEFITMADEIHLTRIQDQFYCDTWFPTWNPLPYYICEPVGMYCQDAIFYIIEKYSLLKQFSE